MEQSPFSVKLSAPGKVILFGEYSVVFKKPAIAATLSLRTNLHLYKTNSETVQLDFSALNLSSSFSLQDIQETFKISPTDSWEAYIKSLTKLFESYYKKISDDVLTDPQKLCLIGFFHCFGRVLGSCGGFSLKVDTELPVGSGVGSSASFSVVLSAAALLFEHFVLKKETSDWIERNESGEVKFSEKFQNQVSELAFSCEKIFHGTPSGVDHNTVLRGSILEFVKSDDGNHKMTHISTKSLKILLVNTNIPRSTKKLVNNFKRLKENHSEIIECVLGGMENIAKSAVKTLIDLNESQKNVSQLEAHFGELVSLNHKLLRVLDASHPALEQIVSTADKFNLKAKLTGAGGGGFGFIYVPRGLEISVAKTVEKELAACGFTVYNVSLGGPGLKIEELIF